MASGALGGVTIPAVSLGLTEANQIRTNLASGVNVTIARSLSDTFSGIRPVDVPGFVLAQLAGALLALAVVGWLLSPAGRHAAATAE